MVYALPAGKESKKKNCEITEGKMIFDFFDDFDWLDIGVLGGLSEKQSEEDRNRKKIEDDWNRDQEDESDY